MDGGCGLCTPQRRKRLSAEPRAAAAAVASVAGGRAEDMLKLLRRRPSWFRVRAIDATATTTLTGNELDWIDPVAKRARVRGQEERQYIRGPHPLLLAAFAAQCPITGIRLRR